jgi:hypothetical protein
MEKEIGLGEQDAGYCLEIPPQQNGMALLIEALEAAFDLRARLDLRRLLFGQPPFACVVV